MLGQILYGKNSWKRLSLIGDETVINPEILMGQSIVLGEIIAEALLHNENSMNDQIIWQRYVQQVESLSLEKVSKLCKEAGFVRVLEVGQYFVTRDVGDFRHFSISGLSRIHLSTRRQSFSTKRVDPRKYENWTCIGSDDQFSALQIWN